jgi:ABC-type multidrug transport system ATPase subunit
MILNVLSLKLPNDQMSAIIKVAGLSKHFGDIRAVEDLSFSVEKGEIYGFLGQNGAGKSTTIRMLLTLVHPTRGEMEVLGMNLKRDRREILRRSEQLSKNRYL